MVADRNGQRIVGHGGDTVVFHSDLHLLLDANVGIFMSFNSAGDAGSAHVVRKAIFQAFLDRYFPKEAPTPATVSTAKADAARVAGWYQASRRNDSALRMLYLLGQVNVAAKPDGTLTVSMLTDYAGKPLQWHETGPLRYSEVNGKSQLAFVTDANGAARGTASETQFSTTWGAGVKIFPSPNVGVRFGAQWTPTYIKTDAAGYWCDPYWGCYVVGDAQYANQFQFNGGLTIRF